MSNERPVIARTPKGRKPQYFSDPAVDRLLGMVLTLAEELSVTRDRLDSVERILAAHALLPEGGVDAFQPDDSADGQRRERRQAFIARLMRVLETELDSMDERGVPAAVASNLEAFSREEL